MTGETISPKDYYNQLKSHDWYAAYSDDYRVTRSGDEDMRRLRALANTSPVHKAIFDAWCAYMWRDHEDKNKKMPEPPGLTDAEVEQVSQEADQQANRWRAEGRVNNLPDMRGPTRRR